MTRSTTAPARLCLARRRRFRPLVLAAALVTILAACSSDDDSGSSTTTAPTEVTSTTLTAPADLPEPETFTGSPEEFYEVPDPLPKGQPGQLIRVQEVRRDADEVVVRVMYHSRDVRDRDRAVTGTIAYPTAPAPDGGWPVIAWAHGTTGLASPCAPSRWSEVGPSFGIEGVRAATDYIGLGPVGERHGYLSGTSEGRSVVDSVRAARQLAEAHAGTTWVAAGHSQGGHAALFTHQISATYAPELDLKGTAAIAPAAMLTETYGAADQVIPRMVGLLAMFGWEADYPELDVDDYLGEEARSYQRAVDETCLNGVVGKMVTIPPDELYAVDPQTTEPAKSIIAENDPGKVRVDAPLLLVYGSADTWVVPARVEALFRRECDQDQVTEMIASQGTDHGTVLGDRAIGPWLQQRLDGEPAQDGCAVEPPATASADTG